MLANSWFGRHSSCGIRANVHVVASIAIQVSPLDSLGEKVEIYLS
jgi:hypothetical protein